MLPRRDHNPLWPSAVAAMHSLLVGGSVWNFSWRGQAHHLLGRSRFRALFIARLQVVARDLVHSKSCTYALWTHRVWHAKTDGTVGMGWGAVRMEWGAMGMGKTLGRGHSSRDRAGTNAAVPRVLGCLGFPEFPGGPSGRSPNRMWLQRCAPCAAHCCLACWPRIGMALLNGN